MQKTINVMRSLYDSVLRNSVLLLLDQRELTGLLSPVGCIIQRSGKEGEIGQVTMYRAIRFKLYFQ